MNKNNLNWTDNRVLGASAAPKSQEAPASRQQTGVSPATYQNTTSTGVSPATYQNTTGTGVSPATYQNMASTGVSPATYQNMNNTGVSPATYQKDSAQQPTTWQDTGAMPFTGVSPAQESYEPMLGNDTQGSVTRNGAYAPMPITGEPGPPSVMDPGYIPAYLRSQIGKRVRAEFVFTNLYLDKTGILREVGFNYFVLQDLATNAMIMCDLYSARFITSI